MAKVPAILLEKLAQLRRRERLLHLVWGSARLVSFLLVAFIIACFIDWLVDMWDETPMELRVVMFCGQLVLAGLAVVLWLLVPQLRRMRDEKLALMVEGKRPELEHRLISALELNRPGARTQGMSPEMLAAMTHEAETQVGRMHFPSLADHARIKRGILVLAPVVVLALGLILLDPGQALALVQRQLLADVEIPRAVTVASASSEVWPSGEEVLLKFTVRGPGVTAGRTGSVRVRPKGEGEDSFTVPLNLEAATGEDSATYVAKVPAGNVEFSYMAKVADGRSRQPGFVFYVPRPSIIKQDAFVILPTYLGLRPDGKPYEQLHAKGDIVGMPGLSVRVVIETQKPIVRAVLQTYGSPLPDLSGPSGLSRMHQIESRMLATLTAATLRSGPAGQLAGLGAACALVANQPLDRKLLTFSSTPTKQVEWSFKLLPTETSYRVVVFDEYGFSSQAETVRVIKIEPEPPPTVVLHPERWQVPPAFRSKAKTAQLLDLEGMPLPMSEDGKPGGLPISYEAHGPYGIGKAQLKIGVIRGGNDSEGDAKKPRLERWVTYSLVEVKESRRPFDKTRGTFVDADDKEAVWFYAVPARAADPWPRIFAGGRFDYQPGWILLEDTGQAFTFQPDDQIVYFIEVFNRNPDPAKALVGKSRLREKDILDWEKFEKWCYDTLQEASRIESLMYLQQQVYDHPWISIFGFK